MTAETSVSTDGAAVELRAVEAEPARIPEPDQPARPLYADISGEAGQQRPVIPEHLRTLDGIRATARLHVRRHGHRIAYHGVRAPAYGLRMAAYAVNGAGRLTGRLMRWMHWADGWILESQAVAAGRTGHSDAMNAHKQGLKTRGSRSRIVSVCALLAAVAIVAGVRYVPRWGWAAVAAAVVVILARHGKPAGKRMVEPAVIAAQYEKLTPDIIVRALGSLGVAGIDKVLREGREIQFTTPVVRDGPGYRVALDLPFGVTVSDVIERRDKLASGLRRPLGCVWPEPAHDEHAGRLVLYVCDEPLSKARQPAWPLLRAGRADLFRELPFGTDQRGRAVTVMLMFANLLIGSIPRQGKTVAMRIVMLAAALDPITELRIFELKGTGDLDPLARCCHHYGSGADDETIEAALKSLQQLADVELVRRAKVIRGLGKDICPESKVTPELARRKALRLHPVVFGLDEAQEAFSHPVYGKEFDRCATAVIKRGPALGIMLVLATQRPDKESLPTGVSANIGIRFCLRVMGQMENDMILGTSAYKSGIRATLMTPGDKGCGYLVGAADHAQVVKTFNINGKAAEVIAARARAQREAAGTLSGFAAGETDQSEARSFAADVLTVFATDQRLWSETIAARLAELIPEAYADVTTEAVASQLRSVGVTVKDVRETGKQPRKGCTREDVEAATGAVRA